MSEDNSKKKITHHYIKNNDFKTLFSSNIYGGVTPNGLININFCIDRGAIPTTTESTLESTPEGLNVFAETKREGKKGIVREVQFGTLVDVRTAKVIVNWLNQKIKQVEDIQSKSKQ